MGKSKSAPKVVEVAAAAIKATKALKKGKRVPEYDVDTKANARKQKKDLIFSCVQKEKSVKVPKKEAKADTKTAKEPKTPSTSAAGGSKSTLLVYNLDLNVERSDLENFFKETDDVLEIRISAEKQTLFTEAAIVEFSSAEGAQKALELRGRRLLGRPIGLEITHHVPLPDFVRKELAKYNL